MWHDDVLDDETEVRRLPLRAMLARIVPLFRPHRRRLALATVLLLISVAAMLAGPLLIRQVLDTSIPAGDRAGVLWRGIAYASLFALGMAAAYIQVVIVARIGLSIITELRLQLFAHLMQLSMAYFDQNPPGKLMARVESDVEKPALSASRDARQPPDGFRELALRIDDAQTARALGIGIRTLSGKLKSYGYAPRTKKFANART